MKTLSISHFLCILLLACSYTAHADLSQTIKQVKPSVVAVGVAYPPKAVPHGKKPSTYWGTGFAIGAGNEIVTNYHVISSHEVDIAKNEKMVVFVGQGERAKAYQAVVHKVDLEHDLAILRIEGKVKPLALANASLIDEGKEVAFTGYPLGMVLGLYPVTNKGIISAVTPVVMPAFSSKSLTAAQIKRLRSPLNVYQLDTSAYPGNSGSPLYDPETGAVIGVLNSVYVKGTKESVLENPSGISYAIPVRHVHNLR